jgi:4-amino-4-deoxy-L-arabinose transferase-like glycosyltransferase
VRAAAPAGRHWTWIAVGAIAAGLVLRLVWVLVLHPPFEHVYSDMAGYVDRATKLVETGELERYDAFYPPGVHLLLAVPLAIFGPDRGGLWAASVLWAVLSGLTPFFMWRLTYILLTPAAAALTAVFTALWPLHITSAGYFLSETPSLTFLVASLAVGYLADRSTGRAPLALAALAGVLGAAAVAMRPQFFLNLLVLAVPWLWAWRRKLRPLLAFTAAGAVIAAAVVAHNSLAADKLTGVSENSGLTFFLGHCDARSVRTGTDPGPIFEFGAPVAAQRGTGRRYEFPDRVVWEQGFFFRQAANCIREDGVGHVRILGRSLVEMTSTTVIWPQSNEPRLKEVVNYTNVAYTVLLPALLIGAFVLIRNRRSRGGGWGGEAVLLAHLLCAFVMALIFFGDPRFRMPYDVFGLALLAAFIADSLFDARPAREPAAP